MSELLTPTTNTGRYVSIKADGKLHEKVEKDTENAVLREYTLKDKKTGVETKGSKWELLYDKIGGTITNVSFETGEYGENVLVTFSDGENEVTLAQGVASKFGEDLLKKLPSVDFAEKVTAQPYSFEGDNGKEIQGVTLYQKSDKVANHFWDGEKKQYLNGFPPIDKTEDEVWSSDDWKIHFLQVRKFLVAYNKDNVASKFADRVKPVGKNDDFKGFEYPEDEINPDDVAF